MRLTPIMQSVAGAKSLPALCLPAGRTADGTGPATRTAASQPWAISARDLDAPLRAHFPVGRPSPGIRLRSPFYFRQPRADTGAMSTFNVALIQLDGCGNDAGANLHRWPAAPRNVATVIDRHGRDVLTYAKVHTCDWVFERWLTSGGTFPVVSLDTCSQGLSPGWIPRWRLPQASLLRADRGAQQWPGVAGAPALGGEAGAPAVGRGLPSRKRRRRPARYIPGLARCGGPG